MVWYGRLVRVNDITQNNRWRKSAVFRSPFQIRTSSSRQLRHYRLEAVLAVGYRVSSPPGTQFRQWAITASLLEKAALDNGFDRDLPPAS